VPAPKLSLKARALRYLSTREYSRLDLRRKLARYATGDEDVDEVLNFLEQNNWLSQERFTESLVHRRAARFGDRRIVAELQSHGVEGEALHDLKANLKETEAARAREIWQRRFGTVAADAQERSKQMRFLLQRGFSQQAVRAAIQGIADDEFPVDGSDDLD
jgi:regulatory protein